MLRYLVFDAAIEMLSECGIDAKTAQATLLPLIKSTIINLETQAPPRALTGTFARADVGAFEAQPGPRGTISGASSGSPAERRSSSASQSVAGSSAHLPRSPGSSRSQQEGFSCTIARSPDARLIDCRTRALGSCHRPKMYS